MHRNQQTNVDMAHLEDLTRGTTVRGILPSRLVEVVDVQWHGTAAVTLVYKDGAGRVAHQLLFRDNEPALEIVTAGRLWRFDADGALLRLVSEAQRIRLAHLFDTLPGGPHLAGRSAAPPDHRRLWGMLLCQPLRFLLADDPGAGKTIMAGLRYVCRPFTREPDFGATSVNYGWRGLWECGQSATL